VGVLWRQTPLMKYLCRASIQASGFSSQVEACDDPEADSPSAAVRCCWGVYSLLLCIHQVLTSIYARLVSSNGGLAADILLSAFSNAPGLRPRQSAMAGPVGRPVPLEDPLPNTRMDVEAHASITSFQLPCTTTPP